DQARDAWMSLARRESAEAWRSEILERARKDAGGLRPSLPTCNDSLSRWRHAADSIPQAAAIMGWDHVLGDWGQAQISGDATTASRTLRCAEIIGAALEDQRRDATLADAVRAIRAASRQSGLVLRLARAHISYGVARAAYTEGKYAVAEPAFQNAATLADQSKPLRLWSMLFHAATLVYTGRTAAGELL